MPHVTIEYSSNVQLHHDIDALVNAVHAAALDDGLPPLAGLRTRAVSREHYQVATGDDELAFVAITARIGPGRSDEQKTRFLTALLDATETMLQPGPLHIAFSAEIQEIDIEFRINRNHVRPYLEGRDQQETTDG